MWKKKDILGQRSGAIVIIECLGKVNGGYRWKYLCDCGVKAEIDGSHFSPKKRAITSCLECAYQKKRKDYDRKHPLYSTWVGMTQRCYNKNTDSYKDYGGRGVVVCEEWRNSYPAFRDWCLENGWRKGLFLDKDERGTGYLYSPSECSITTRRGNNRKRRNVKMSLEIAKEIRQSTLSVKELSAKYGAGESTIRRVINNENWMD